MSAATLCVHCCAVCCCSCLGGAGAHSQYESAMLEAFELEDIVKCRSLKDYLPR